MSRELEDIAAKAVAGAVRRGAQGARASAYSSRASTLEWRDGKLDRLKESTSRGVALTLFVDGRYSSNSTSDLRPSALEKFLDDTIAMTKLLAKDPHRKLPEPERYRGRFEGDLKIFDEAGSSRLTPNLRRRLARQLEEAARSVPGAEDIVSVTGAVSDEQFEAALVASNGLAASRRATNFSYFAVVSVKDEGERKPEGYYWAGSTKLAELPAVEQVGGEAARRAFALRRSRPEKSGRYPCAIENLVGARLIGDLLSVLYGQAIQQKRSFLADKLGQQVLSPLLTIEDDPLLPGGLASRPYDQEGMTRNKLVLFEKGVLKNFLLDTYYASKLGREPTTGTATNLVFATGSRDLAGLLKEMGKGILITGFSGGNCNMATGDFSVGVRGLWIENGQPVRAVSEMNLSGNHLEFWKALQAAGNDPFVYSSTRTPSLLFSPVQFSGA